MLQNVMEGGGRGSKNGQICITYLMNGPLSVLAAKTANFFEIFFNFRFIRDELKHVDKGFRATP